MHTKATHFAKVAQQKKIQRLVNQRKKLDELIEQEKEKLRAERF